MNKKLLILTGLLILVITINFFTLHIKSKNELKSEFQNYSSFVKIVNNIANLKNKYSTSPLKALKPICHITSGKIICKNISKSNLRKINYFLKSNIKIKKFSIKSQNNKFDFYAEIIK